MENGNLSEKRPFKVETDGEWKKFLMKRQKDVKKAAPETGRLVDSLEKAVPGSVACLHPSGEEDLDAILDFGILFLPGKDLGLMKGRRNGCHENAARLWDENRDKSRIATGYGLFDDGVWRQHSWCAQSRDGADPYQEDDSDPAMWRVWETTEPCLAYFGFILNRDGCEKFLADNG